MNILPKLQPPAGPPGASIRAELAAALGGGHLEVPMLPEVAARVVALATRPEADADSLSRLIAADPTLAAHVMRVAASAAYQPNAAIGSLQHAIAWLGLDEIADIAFTAAVQGRLLSVPGHRLTVMHLWRSSVTAALWAREIAAVARAQGEAAYLCGLLHQIGKPVTLLAASDLALRHGLRLTEADYGQLMDELGVGVGEAVARCWRLPPPVASCIRWWRDPGSAPEHRVEVRGVALAHDLARRLLEQGAAFDRGTVVDQAVLDELGIAPDRFNGLLDRADWVLSQARAY